MSHVLNLARGERVRVRSEEEILATLDTQGDLDGLPFMPEMLRFCGRELQVDARADKTCDTISGSLASRGMKHAVHLADVRCDGAAHGGCEADCLIFWKEAWLERIGTPRVHPLWRWVADAAPNAEPPKAETNCCTEDLDEHAMRSPATADHGPVYRCQTTELLSATTPLSAWAPRQYLRDWLSGNVPLDYILRIAILRILRRIVVLGRGFQLKLKFYDAMARLFGEPAWPYHAGRLSGRTPSEQLDLQPGEWVKVRSHEEILETLNDRSNRGMSFTAEMVRYCGRTFRVRSRVDQILDEATGELISMKRDCVILEDVVCRSECSTGRLFCPRAIYPYWREIWLRRASPPAPTPTSTNTPGASGSVAQ